MDQFLFKQDTFKYYTIRPGVRGVYSCCSFAFLNTLKDHLYVPTMANWYQYLENEIEKWSSEAKWGQVGPNGVKRG